MDFAILPRIITQDLYPNIYRVTSNGPLPIIDESLDTYPYPYAHNPMPSSLTYGIDPKYVLPPQKYEYRYVNKNGIDIVIRGAYDDVMSTVDVLNAYPPLKRDPTSVHNNLPQTYYDIVTGKPLNANGKYQPKVPSVGISDRGDHIFVSMDNNKSYSGSGALIMVVTNGKPLTESKFVLFRDVNTHLYQELGGRIDKPSGANVDTEILFTNAKRESEEESMILFKLNTKSPIFVDIESQENNTYYRIFLYVITMNNPAQLSLMYEENKAQVLTNYSANFNEAYRESDKLDLFDYQTFINKLKTYGTSGQNVSSGIFMTTSGTNVNVRGRTIKAIYKFLNDGVLADVINKQTPITATINRITPRSSTIFNNVLL
jgi:hypothetical protein